MTDKATCPSCGAEHSHKIEESHGRSLLIGATSNAIEFAIDFLFFNLVLRQPFLIAGAASLAAICICYLSTYMTLRLWKNIKYGRKVIESGIQT
jgi:hypothetical protein